MNILMSTVVFIMLTFSLSNETIFVNPNEIQAMGTQEDGTGCGLIMKDGGIYEVEQSCEDVNILIRNAIRETK